MRKPGCISVKQEHPQPITILSEDGDSIYVHPGVHHNIQEKFRWGLAQHDRANELHPETRMSVAQHGKGVKESSIAKAARLKAEKDAAIKVPQVKTADQQ